MKYMGDSDWWNARFRDRELNIMGHEKSLEDDIGFFPKKGPILDIACGDGRNTIYLARLGYEVVAIDFCEEALKRLNYFAEKESLKIKTRLLDLSKEESFTGLNNMEAVVINHYRLKPQFYTNLMNSLNTGGILWVNGFSEVPADHPNINESDILKESDFIFLDSNKLEHINRYSINQRKFLRGIWKK